MWFQPLEYWNLDFVSAVALSCCSCRRQEGAFPERSFVQINTEWIRVAISLNGDGSVSPFLILDDLNLAMSLKRVLSQELVSPRRGIRTMRQMLAVPILDFSGREARELCPWLSPSVDMGPTWGYSWWTWSGSCHWPCETDGTRYFGHIPLDILFIGHL